MPNNVTDILRGVVSELREISRSETIIGEPVQAGERTVIPIVKISVGFGVGGGEGSESGSKAGFGGGGGGGAKIEPAAFLIIDKDDVRLITATSKPFRVSRRRSARCSTRLVVTRTTRRTTARTATAKGTVRATMVKTVRPLRRTKTSTDKIRLTRRRKAD